MHFIMIHCHFVSKAILRAEYWIVEGSPRPLSVNPLDTILCFISVHVGGIGFNVHDWTAVFNQIQLILLRYQAGIYIYLFLS